MKYEDIENARKADIVLKRIDAAIEGINKRREEFLDETLLKKDFGGIDGVADIGYLCNLSNHPDGSGDAVDMSGCYVAKEVNEAVLNVLKEKRKEIIRYMFSIGINFPETVD